MNGLEKITQRITEDARAEAEALLAQAQQEANAILAQGEEQARKEAADIAARGERDAAERVARLESVAQLEGRKHLLSAKQEMIDRAFDQALEKLLALPQEEYIDLLSDLCARAAASGREEIIFSQRDRELGEAVCAKANELLARKAAPELPERLADSPVGAVLDKVITAGSAIMTGTGMLTVSRETRDIKGGFILASEGVETNCSFDTLVRLARPRLEREVARILFEG